MLLNSTSPNKGMKQTKPAQAMELRSLSLVFDGQPRVRNRHPSGGPVKQRRANGRTQICMTVEKDGVWVYGNPEALRRIAERLALLAESKPSEHYELHVKWHLGSHRAKRQGVFVLVDSEARRVHRREAFELTFMVVEPSDLRGLRRHERSGVLPKAWRKATDEPERRRPVRGSTSRRTRG
jgi:hypothetical protein